jgi:hypothetical protein
MGLVLPIKGHHQIIVNETLAPCLAVGSLCVCGEMEGGRGRNKEREREVLRRESYDSSRQVFVPWRRGRSGYYIFSAPLK